MAIICPTITAYDPHEYRAQMERIQPFAERVHIDLMDGEFAPTVSPGLDQVWWPESVVADIHLMYQEPMGQLAQLANLKPNLVVVHVESKLAHMAFTTALHQAGIKAGLAILRDTAIEPCLPTIEQYDHVLVFSGDLGRHGGVADLNLLKKVEAVRHAYPDKEISWDGGINDQNIIQLMAAGVTVLNTGGFIQHADDPAAAYRRLQELAA